MGLGTGRSGRFVPGRIGQAECSQARGPGLVLVIGFGARREAHERTVPAKVAKWLLRRRPAVEAAAGFALKALDWSRSACRSPSPAAPRSPTRATRSLNVSCAGRSRSATGRCCTRWVLRSPCTSPIPPPTPAGRCGTRWSPTCRSAASCTYLCPSDRRRTVSCRCTTTNRMLSASTTRPSPTSSRATRRSRSPRSDTRISWPR